eukprot:g12300.t1
MIDFLLQTENKQILKTEKEERLRARNQQNNKMGSLGMGLMKRKYSTHVVDNVHDEEHASTQVRTGVGVRRGGSGNAAGNSSPSPGGGEMSSSDAGRDDFRGDFYREVEYFDVSKLRLPRVVDHEGRTPLFVAAFHRRRNAADRLYAITYEQENVVPVGDDEGLRTPSGVAGGAVVGGDRTGSGRKQKVASAAGGGSGSQTDQTPTKGTAAENTPPAGASAATSSLQLQPGQVIPPSHVNQPEDEDLPDQDLKTPPQDPLQKLHESQHPAYWDVVTEQDVMVGQGSTKWQAQWYIPKYVSDSLGLKEYQSMKGGLPLQPPGANPGDTNPKHHRSQLLPPIGRGSCVVGPRSGASPPSGSAELHYGADSFLGENKSRHERNRKEQIMNADLRDSLSQSRYLQFLEHELHPSSNSLRGSASKMQFSGSSPRVGSRGSTDGALEGVPNTNELLTAHIASGKVRISAEAYCRGNGGSRGGSRGR